MQHIDSFLSRVLSAGPPLTSLLLFISTTLAPAFHSCPLNCPSLSPVHSLSQQHPATPLGLRVFGVCGQPHPGTLSLEPYLLGHLWGFPVTTHSKFKPASSFTLGPLSCSRCPQRLLLCPGPLRVPFQPLLSYLPAPGTLCPPKRAARTGCPPADNRWLGVSPFPFVVTEPAGRWVPRTGYFCGSLYFCSFSNTHTPRPHLPGSVESVVQ